MVADKCNNDECLKHFIPILSKRSITLTSIIFAKASLMTVAAKFVSVVLVCSNIEVKENSKEK